MSTPGAASGPLDSSITYTFILNIAGGSGLPAVAVQTGAGFMPLTIQNNQITLTLSSSSAPYAIALDCLEPETGNNVETIFEATPQDGTAFTAGCERSPAIQPGNPPPPAAGNATGTVDATAITGVQDVNIYGIAGLVRSPSGLPIMGPFTVQMPSGTYDVGVVADGSNSALAVKILRAQTVPGTLNGGCTIAFNSSDQVGTAPLNVTNLSAGFSPQVSTAYQTAAGTVIPLAVTTDVTQYTTVPTGATKTGDMYQISVSAADANKSTVELAQTASGGGPVTLGPLPDPWSYSGPTPAALPTFAFDTYSGFNGQMPTQTAIISWSQPVMFRPQNPFFIISVTASSSFLNGSTAALTVPDLSGITGFQGTSPSGTTVSWSARIFANNSTALVSNQGTYTEP